MSVVRWQCPFVKTPFASCCQFVPVPCSFCLCGTSAGRPDTGEHSSLLAAQLSGTIEASPLSTSSSSSLAERNMKHAQEAADAAAIQRQACEWRLCVGGFCLHCRLSLGQGCTLACLPASRSLTIYSLWACCLQAFCNQIDLSTLHTHSNMPRLSCRIAHIAAGAHSAQEAAAD